MSDGIMYLLLVGISVAVVGIPVTLTPLPFSGEQAREEFLWEKCPYGSCLDGVLYALGVRDKRDSLIYYQSGRHLDDVFVPLRE